ncbi:MAG: helix-turn-helix domain-containing protein [Actinomycetota bacterium]
MDRPDDIEQGLSLRALKALRLRTLRKQSGKSVAEVARIMGVPEKTVGRLLAGKASDEMIERYLRAIGCSPVDLLRSPNTPSYIRQQDADPDPPPLRLVAAIADEDPVEAGGVLSFRAPASVVGPKTVSPQGIRSASSVSHGPRSSPAGPGRR